MSDRSALIIAVEACGTSYVESDAHAFAHVMELHGVSADNRLQLIGVEATKTAIDSRLRKIRKTPPKVDTLFAWIAGPAFAQDDADYLACADSQADDLADTSLAIEALLEALGTIECQKLLLFFDPRSLAEEEPMELEQLEKFAKEKPGRMVLVSHDPDENSQVSGALKSAIWTHHVLEALSGKAARALEGTILTADSLNEWLSREMPKTLGATFREAPSQTPTLLKGQAAIPIVDVSQILDQTKAVDDPRLAPLKRGVLRSETLIKIKSLSGFRKGMRLPDRVNATSKKMVADMASEDVKKEIDEMYTKIRDTMGYKRREVEGSSDRGTGMVRTPEFEFSINVELSNDDLSEVIWRREVAAIKSPTVVMSAAFRQVFGAIFDTLVFEFTRPFDLESWVDRIEEVMPAGVKLRTASDCTSCEVVVLGFLGVIRLFGDRVEIQGKQTPKSKSLVDAFLSFQDLFDGRQDLQALPLLEER